MFAANVFGLLSIILLSSDLCLSIHDQTKYYFFYRSGGEYKNQTYNYDELMQITRNPNFNRKLKTVIFFHGYAQSVTTPQILQLIDAYSTRKDHNPIFLDWAEEASGDYPTLALPNTIKLGTDLGDVILNAFKNGLCRKRFYMVGHSLGAQLAGVIGRRIIAQSNGKKKVARICGLDPAGPGFYYTTTNNGTTFYQPLSALDAKFVDIIHTDAGGLGMPIATGTVNFWPNNGTRFQPGCPVGNFETLSPNGVCSHQRSVYFFEESVRLPRKRKFIGVAASSWNDFQNRRTNRRDLVEMGLNVKRRARGNYYLQTDSQSPYARGCAGTIYRK